MTVQTPDLPAFFEGIAPLKPGRHKIPVEQVARSQRERLMDGMLVSVGQNGYLATTVADALAHAGVSRRTYYEHFADKEDCYLHAVEHVMTRVQAVVRAAFEAEPEWRDGVRGALDVLLRTLAAQPAYARACLIEIVALGSEGVRRRMAALEAFQRVVDRGRERAPDDLWLPETLAETIVGGIAETVAARLARDEADRLPELLDDLVYWVVVPFAGRRAAAARPEPIAA